MSASQSLTLLLGALIIVTTILEYNATVYAVGLKSVVQEIEASLGFLLVAYTLVIAGETGRDAEMHKFFLVGLCLASWGLVAFNKDPENDTQWQNVTNRIARPIFNGSLFALPMVFYAFKA